MPNLLETIRGGGIRSQGSPLDIDEWASYFTFGGLAYQLFGNQTLVGNKEQPEQTFTGLVRQAYKQNGIVFAVEMVRLHHFTEMRFQYQRMRDGKPGDLWGASSLAPLENPWPGGQTRDLLARMLVDVDFGGNAYIARRPNNRLMRLRPDWVTILIGSYSDDEVMPWDLDAEVLGYFYTPGGVGSGSDPVLFMPEEVAHWAPVPDPEAAYRGMSWLHPVIWDILGDKAATSHKLKFFENGATPNMAVQLDIEPEEFDKWIQIYKEKYEGHANAYKTLFLGTGAEIVPIGTNFQQLDFKNTVGVSETRIAAAGGVPPTIVGLSEGLQGSTLNAGNYGMARRRFGDGTMRPLWGGCADALSRIVSPPGGSRLWYDDRHIAFLKEDVADAAEVLKVQSEAVGLLTDKGFTPESSVAAVTSGDLTLLKHSGKFSVQLQDNEPEEEAPPQNGKTTLQPTGLPTK